MMKERFNLACERMAQIQEENIIKEPFADYFKQVSDFLLQMNRLYKDILKKDWEKAALYSLQEQNRLLYLDVLPQNYGHSYANPSYAAEQLGEEFGQLLCFVYAEMRSLIPSAFEGNLFFMTICFELFLEIYTSFCNSYEESGDAPKKEEIRQIIYWHMSDYSEPMMEMRLEEQLNPQSQYAIGVIMNSDLEDIKYLFQFGEYITENELKTAIFLNSLPKETIAKMADTYTEGFKQGFINGNKDMSKKKTVNIRYSLGFERVIKKAIANFAQMGLQPIIYRAGVSAFYKRGTMKIGYYGACANKQYEYDHKEDEAIFWDKLLINRKTEVLKAAYDARKKLAEEMAGPACVEVFGETPFVPINKKEAVRLTEEQQKLSVDYDSKSGQIVNEYIKGEERSFTIIAFPTPEIGKDYERIFDEIIRINTLDYKLYEGLQQTIIDVLDKAEKVWIKGKDGNKTDLTVSLPKLENPDKETLFENCVADVNIPVGEVFTSPQLEGTNGILNVSKVFLNELEYQDLTIEFVNGKIKSYSCSNFGTEEENKKYIKDNVLFHHDTLPIGEFAIGTNTTAYVVSRKYGLENKLPILIAEKTGPHFAVGDTCYSHSEDVKVYNPNGKEIMAKDNEISALRKEDIRKAYFHCHTDITIPYDELGLLSAIYQNGEEIPIIRNGRFVLEGVEELNNPFDEEITG